MIIWFGVCIVLLTWSACSLFLNPEIGIIGVLFYVNCEGAKTVSLFPIDLLMSENWKQVYSFSV